jgi:hypothetical protein
MKQIIKYLLIVTMVITLGYLTAEYKHFERGCYKPLGNYDGKFCWMFGHVRWIVGDYGMNIKISKNVKLN